MSNLIIVKKRIKKFDKEIKVTGDKSISIRWVLFSSLADGVSKAENLLISEDVLAAIKSVKNLGIKVILKKNICKIFGKGIDGYNYKNNLVINAKNSGTLGRLILGFLCKYLKLPLTVKRKKEFDEIKIKKVKKINPLNYIIPSDISSSAFFIVLTALSKNSKLIIKNVNTNPSRTGIITILKKMGVKITFKNKKMYKGENNADIHIESAKKLKPINCPAKLNSGAIDEFLVIFLVAAKANGISYFKELGELNQKESPRLKWGTIILNKMGIKTITTKNSIKIFGNPNIEINKKIVIKDFLKDHRVFMTSMIAALSFGGEWYIHDKDSIKTSFPSFLDILDNFKK